MLKSNEPSDLMKFGLKVYNPTDSPESFTDTLIDDFNWNPKGVVLYDHSISGGDKRVKLEIFYTELNN